MSLTPQPIPTDYERLVLSGKDYFPLPAPSPKESWESKVRTVTLALASKAPYIGSAISFIIKSFWKEAKADIWAQISDNVSNVIKLAFLEFEMNRDGSELMAIKSDMISYVMAKNKTEQAMKLSILISKCTEMYFKLTKSKQKIELIPFTVTFSIIHLGILKERINSGKSLFGEFDEAWVFDLQQQIDSYQTFFREQIPELINWRSQQIIYESVTTGLFIKDTDILLKDKFTDNNNFKQNYRFVDGKDYRREEVLKIKEGWMSFWNADFAQSYASFFYTNRLMPGAENAPPNIDPHFNIITIGPFSPGNENTFHAMRPANENQKGGKIKEIIFNYGNNMDSFQVNFEDHDGLRPTKIGGDKMKVVKADPDKEIVALRFYHSGSRYESALRSINFVYEDGTESETVMVKEKQTLDFKEIRIPKNYKITNLRSARDTRSSTGNFYYWFWLELTFNPIYL
ncbi:hypothetical protein HDE68_002994 [Pedobacter cryoconitis]|uniref:Pesticidal crystal protein N-terminal domain-containing protein n=1 Tax=Pedobacter cryoconitis TaxID=188932 RepID=A0A7W8ZN48_9SPHI|nr:hypothetical protein [Pedobacter cryoconitis]MBB5637081.1 hypothetical protein [Pedobacter cryoconitis]